MATICVVHEFFLSLLFKDMFVFYETGNQNATIITLNLCKFCIVSKNARSLDKRMGAVTAPI